MITNVPADHPSHMVDVVADILLHDIIGSDVHPVNSLRHQGLSWAELSPDYLAVATPEDGLVEAFLSKTYPDRFILGVQWHLEHLALRGLKDQKIFEGSSMQQLKTVRKTSLGLPKIVF